MTSRSPRARFTRAVPAMLFGAFALGIVAQPVLVAQPAADEQPNPNAQPNAQPDERRVGEAIRSLWDDDSGENRNQQRRTIMGAAFGNPEMIERALRVGPAFPTAGKTGAGEMTFPGRTGDRQVAGTFVPTAYDPATPRPLLVFLHGGATSTETNRGPRAIAQWQSFCEQNNYLMLAPSGYRGASWWEFNGLYNVLRAVKLFKGMVNVDEDKVFLVGFSDGGAGALYILDHFSTPFAGAISLSGHPGVAGGENAYGQFSFYNLAQRSVMLVNSANDPLYPAEKIEPFIDSMKQAGMAVEFKVVETAGHDLSYLASEGPAIAKFIDSHSRDANPERLTWEWDGTPALNRNAWLILMDVGQPVEGEPAIPDINTQVSRATLGVEIDENSPGRGVKISAVQADTAADFAGLFAGDRIVKVGETAIANAAELRTALAGSKAGDIAHIFVEREGEGEIEVIVEFPPARTVFSRRNPMGLARARVDKATNTVHIQSRGVKKLRILVTRLLLDINRPIKVVVNGTVAFEGKLMSDSQFLINQHASDRDRKQLYLNLIDVIVPAPSRDGSDW